MSSIYHDAAYTLIVSPLEHSESPQIVALRGAKHRANQFEVTAWCSSSERLIYRRVKYVC